MREVIAFVTAALIAAILAGWTRYYALHRGVLDHPNERSSHTVPTPRGGGIGMVVAMIAALLLSPFPAPAAGLSWAAAGAVALVGMIGWVDDHRSLSVRVRLAGHFVGAGLAAVAAVGSAPLLGRAGQAMPLAVGVVWWVFWTVSSINVVNFMDGIDGIIGLQALVYGAFCWTAASADGSGQLGAALAGAALGFLCLNWSPARIFMGDVGSGALGVCFVLVGAMTMRERGWSVVHAFFPLMPLFADEVLTMSRRLWRREPIWQAHRTHVYQRLVQAGWSHARTSLLFGALAAACAIWPLVEPSLSPRFLAGGAAILTACFALLLGLRTSAERAGASHVVQSTSPKAHSHST